MHIVNASGKEGFDPGVTYKFDPAVETNCIAVAGNRGWERKSFSEGWCLKFENGIGVFQGKPVGERGSYYFKVKYGGGSIATETK